MSVSDGEKVNAAITNAAFMSRTVDDNTTGKKDLENVDGASGSSIFNIQRSHNGAHSFAGSAPNGLENQVPAWTSDVIGTPNDPIKDRVDDVQAQVETNDIDIATNAAGIVTNAQESADIRTTQGTANGATDLGAFSGVTITDNVAVKVALQELETALEVVSSPLLFQGTWDANTNSPALASGVGTAGHFYIVSVAGATNLDGITDWQINDWAVFEGGTWQKIDNTELVTSVNGATGAVSLALDDLNNVTEISIATGDFLRWSGSAWVNSKELDIAGTASLTQRLVVSSDTTANLTALARKAGAVYWSTDELVYKGDDGTSLISLGSGGGGSGLKNYYDDYGDFEGATDVSGNATLFNDPAGYVDGDGGVVAGLSVAQDTGASVLVNDASLAITKAAVDSTDDGVTFLTRTIDRADYGRLLYGSFEFDGTDANYTSLDFSVKAYDVTNAAELAVVIDSDLTNQKGKARFKVLPQATTASVRVSLYLLSDSLPGSAFTVYLDDLKLGPDSGLEMLAGTDTYARIYNSVGQTVVAGVPEALEYDTLDYVKNMDVDLASNNITVLQDGLYHMVGSIGTSNPGDNTQMINRIMVNGVIEGFGVAVAAGTGTDPSGLSVVTLQLVAGDIVSGEVSPGASDDLTAGSNRAYLEIRRVDSTSALLSTTETLFQSASARILLSVNQTGLDTTIQKIEFDTVDYDNVGMFSASDNGYIIPEDGIYDVSSNMNPTAASSGTRFTLYLQINTTNSQRSLAGSPISNTGVLFSDRLQFSKGDVLTMGVLNNSDVAWEAVAGTNHTYFAIARRPDLSAFGVFGEHEYLETELVNPLITTAADTYTDADSVASLTLSPGTWQIGYNVTGRVGYTGTVGLNYGNVIITDSANTAVPGTLGQMGTRLDATIVASDIPMSRQSELTIAQTTTYKLRLRCSLANTGGTMQILTSLGITGGLTNPDVESMFWARRMR